MESEEQKATEDEARPSGSEPSAAVRVEVLRTPAEWSALEDTTVMDPDGWRGCRDLPAKDWNEPISHDEWDQRWTVSSVIRKVASGKGDAA